MTHKKRYMYDIKNLKKRNGTKIKLSLFGICCSILCKYLAEAYKNCLSLSNTTLTRTDHMDHLPPDFK